MHAYLECNDTGFYGYYADTSSIVTNKFCACKGKAFYYSRRLQNTCCVQDDQFIGHESWKKKTGVVFDRHIPCTLLKVHVDGKKNKKVFEPHLEKNK